MNLYDALFFANLSKQSYNDRLHVEGYSVELFSDNGAQAFLLESKTEQIIIFRGTDEPEDWIVDVSFKFRDGVQSGFLAYSEILFGLIKHRLDDNKKLWLTGHSLGGAIAVVFSHLIQREDVIIYTFGSPRIGSNRFVNNTKVEHYRFSAAYDYAPMTPLYPYFHHGQLIYINSKGQITKGYNTFDRIKDRLTGKFIPDSHNINYYIKCLENSFDVKDNLYNRFQVGGIQ
jgi:triacylglycerol lipase